ncbi:uncharacterized protein TNIN_385821 [Trichonephila inaurata madagascariensis]|uniref:Helitron helicase-like domain-containing protein n=1 Tax=Trichonephila inaurata madagascariensis TaxID=2747483 RepID=A0A8X6WNP2_9ARAC|nr:uncharacterized protein TNIN_385821 [Trichonephila inaurata madagascariensis]
MYSVEWQKRGLPHAHILIWLETKILAEKIDDVIRAELPDQEVDPESFNVVKTQLVHGHVALTIFDLRQCSWNGRKSEKYDIDGVFDLCHKDEFAAPLFYEEISNFITHLINKMEHSNDDCRDTPMEGHPSIFHEHTLGRIYAPIHPNNRECYHLRILLNVVKGPTSFESLKRVNGGNTLPHYDLPSPLAIDGIVENLNREYIEHTIFNPFELQHTINQNEARLDNEQNQVYRLS